MRFFILNRHKKAPIKGLDIFTVVPRVGKLTKRRESYEKKYSFTFHASNITLTCLLILSFNRQLTK